VLALSDLEESEAAVLNRLTSQSGQRTYDRAITDFVACYCSGPRLAFNRHQDSVQLREEHWVIADLLGKAGHIRTVPIPDWVKTAIDDWKQTNGVTDGTLFRSIDKTGRVWGHGMTPKVLWKIVREAAARAGIEKLAPHDLRRTCARLCHLAGGELDQIQFLFGHVSIQTTERHLGCQRKPRGAVNDRMGIEPEENR
jgi:integrase